MEYSWFFHEVDSAPILKNLEGKWDSGDTDTKWGRCDSMGAMGRAGSAMVQPLTPSPYLHSQD